MSRFKSKLPWALGAALALLTACAPSSYPITAPSATGIKYAKTDAPRVQVAVLDERSDRVFSTGTLPGALTVDGTLVDPPRFLAANLSQELTSRGLAVDAAVDGKDLPKLHLKTFRMQNSRSSGFSPFYSHTFLSADLESAAGTGRIGIYVQGDKVPVWSFNEVIEPVFNQPMAIASQELSSKVANLLFKYQASDDQVKDLIARISDPSSKTRYRDTYALGFTNNPAAVDKLVALTKDEDDYVRLAAMSSLGTLRATGAFPLLKTVYEDPKSLWQEQAMAMKAIGDLETEDAKAYLAAELKRLGGLPQNTDNARMTQIVMMYAR